MTKTIINSTRITEQLKMIGRDREVQRINLRETEKLKNIEIIKYK